MTLDARQLVLLLALFTDVVMTDCSAGCTSCSGSTCLKCESSYYLSDGICSPCPEQCTSCNGYNNCTSCKPGKWGSEIQCKLTCADSCYNKECQYDTGDCVQCKSGLYGPQCRHDCSDFEGSLCELRRCTHGCKPGYYEYKTQLESFCQNCPSDCRYCNDANTCHVCNDGFHLYQFHSKQKAYVQCVVCSLGSKCSSYCAIQNCNHCQIQDGALMCTDCPDGYRFNGSVCISNTISCSEKCSSHCDDDGICLGSCSTGWTGEKCCEQCSDKCLACNKINSDICQQCIGDFYTVSCNVACSPSCITEEGKQTCRLNDGYCLNGCEHNFWGPVCDQSCSSDCMNNRISPICERSNGTCKHGCKDGYTGYKCDIIAATSKTTFKPEDRSQTSVKSEAATTTQAQISTQCDCKENCDFNSIFIGGFFSGIGVSIAVAVTSVALYKLRQRYISKKLKLRQDSKNTFEMPTYYNEEGGQPIETQEATNETNNYESLGNTRNTDNVYNDLKTTTVQ